MCRTQVQHNNVQQLQCHYSHRNLPEAILYGPMILFTDSIVLNSIARGDDVCFHVMNAFLVSGAVQFTCFIPCNNALQKLVFLIGITYQMHRKSPIQQALWSSAKFFGNGSAHTLFLIQVVVDKAVYPTQQNV